ncbi:MAG: tetratricopeptide repeat protein [Methanomicrobiales archaeon]
MKKTRAAELKNEGNNYFKQGDYEKALQCYGKAVELVPDYRDAWNNIYLTLVKQERTDEAAKCKEILEKLSNGPKTQPKTLGPKHFSMAQKIFIVFITILLVIAVVVATEALMGVGVKKSSPGQIETTMNTLAALSPVSLNITGNNSSGISMPSSVGMVSDSFDTVQNSLVAISPIGLDIRAGNTSGTNSSLPS